MYPIGTFRTTSSTLRNGHRGDTRVIDHRRDVDRECRWMRTRPDRDCRLNQLIWIGKTKC
jgi:hypothetical protein